MKNLETFLTELSQNEMLAKALAAAVQSEKVDAFLKEHGVDATAEQLLDALKQRDFSELADDALGAVAGGVLRELNPKKIIKGGLDLAGLGDADPEQSNGIPKSILKGIPKSIL